MIAQIPSEIARKSPNFSRYGMAVDYFVDRFLRLGALLVVDRKLRIEYPGAIYHVLNRGDPRVKITWGSQILCHISLLPSSG